MKRKVSKILPKKKKKNGVFIVPRVYPIQPFFTGLSDEILNLSEGGRKPEGKTTRHPQGEERPFPHASWARSVGSDSGSVSNNRRIKMLITCRS